MERLIVNGGKRLEGEVPISGAKNSSLPILLSSLLTSEKLILHNLPHLQDVTTMITLLRILKVNITMRDGMVVMAQANDIRNFTAPYDLVRTMRASILVLGPLLTRFRQAKVSLPGGCAIGSRPIDMHLDALMKMGAKCTIDHGYIDCEAPKGLKGIKYKFDKVTVTGTENILMAATLAKGTTVLKNAACEPEIVDLANCLIAMGAKIQGHGTKTIVIEGVKELKGAEYSILPDRIETGTYLVAAAITGGNIRLTNTNSKYLGAIIEKLEQAGATVKSDKDWIELIMKKQQPNAVNVQTAPYPNFPTDMQAQFIALNSIAKGKSQVVENVFENRFMHVGEMQRMGAQIAIEHNTALIEGIPKLVGSEVMASDLRASASLILSALVAEGQSTVNRIYHIDRGYECIEEKLQKLGADIKRISH